MRITNAKDVTQYYQQEDVAEGYIDKRFTEPLNVIEHQRQVTILNKIIRNNNIQNVIEFAPGPARLTSELQIENGISIDASESMLTIARRRMNNIGKKWTFIKDDILNLQYNNKHDLVFSFRFFLHFKSDERKKIYEQASSVLHPEGLLVFEVMNKEMVLPLRKLLGKKRYFVYDKLYHKNELIKELSENGFELVALYPVLKHFWLQAFFSRPWKICGLQKQAIRSVAFFEKFKTRNPYEWVAVCQKR
jgi:ubiquinone/menaquinone biosynthesis C-methylase UbiE